MCFCAGGQELSVEDKGWSLGAWARCNGPVVGDHGDLLSKVAGPLMGHGRRVQT